MPIIRLEGEGRRKTLILWWLALQVRRYLEGGSGALVIGEAILMAGKDFLVVPDGVRL